ncbi:hypothetical protein LEMLEM_LOCUS17929 [Lemmus lemmus]
MEHHYKADVDCGLSYSECNMGNETRAPLFVGPGLRGPAKHRGRGHRCATRIQTSEKRVHGTLLKRRQIRLRSTTRVVAHKPLCQGKNSSAKARGHSEWGWLGREPGFDGREEISQGPLFLCCPPAFSPAPYMTMTLGKQLIASPSMELHEAFALCNP